MRSDVKEIDAIVAVKVSSLRTPVKDSITGTCSKCSEEVWLSPKTVKATGLLPEIFCVECALELVKDEKDIELVTGDN